MLPDLPRDEARRIGGEQEIIARYEREKAIETLPALLANHKDRGRLLALLDHVLADPRVQHIEPTEAQRATLARIRSVLGAASRLPAVPQRGNGSGRIAKRVKPRRPAAAALAKP